MMEYSSTECLPRLIVATLEEMAAVLAQLPAGFYERPLPLLEGNSIGMHVRHVIEFFECLVKQLPQGIIDYDLRERQKHIEQDRQAALMAIARLQKQLLTFGQDVSLQLKALIMPDTAKVSVPTTLFRELVYNLEHVIHHAALIRTAVLHYHLQMCLSESFGLAPSTLKYRQYS